MTPRVLRARAFAKINLTLRVLGVRADGYHDLRTTFQSLALHDTLTFAPSKTLTLECDDPRCPPDERNLVWRAAVEMWRAAGRKGAPSGVGVTLAKRVPMQAGLGGGSSDAAAALRAFAMLWNVKDAAVSRIAAGLGADVPFFLRGGTALGVDRGDVLFPLADWPASAVVIVIPNFGVSTKDAYGWFDEGQVGVRHLSDPGQFPEMWNDLEAPVAARHPGISRMVRALRRAGASYAAMSGSGSAVFGLFGTLKAAQEAASALDRPGRRALVTRTLGYSSFTARSRPA